jgi:hypothetical protein
MTWEEKGMKILKDFPSLGRGFDSHRPLHKF